MTGLTFAHLVDIEQIRELLETHYKITGIGAAILDTEENIMAAVGYHDICTRFHLVHPIAKLNCRESDAYIKAHLSGCNGGYLDYRCKNGLVGVAVPIIIKGEHLATFLTGQFFYDDDKPDPEYFRKQAEIFGFDEADYLDALGKVPIFTRDKIHIIVEYYRNLVRIITGMGLKNLELCREAADRKRAEEALRESETRVRRKLDSILDPVGDIGELDLADIIDAQGIQALMEDLYRLTGLKMSIIDLKGWVLVDVGWQNICLEFHRAHPETRMKCLESDTDLTMGVPPGEFRQYRCRNSMWHLVTPIIVGGRHMGNLFMGQFVFDSEELDYDLFRSQARRYGFPEAEYIAALEAVPRYSEESVNTGKAVFLRLTDMFSKLSYANIKLARTLTEREKLTATLREANLVVENSPVVLFRWKASDEWPVELVSGNVIQFGYSPDEFLSGAISYSSIIHPGDLERVTREVRYFSAEGVTQFQLEYRIIARDGKVRWINEHTKAERNTEGCLTHFQGIVIDVTERKRVENALRKAYDEMESRVRERTGQLTSLTAELSLAEERERRRIASELHDQVGQTLVLSKLKLNSLTHRLPSAEFETLLGEIKGHIGRSIEDIRSLTFQLSPPLLYEVGFEAAVEWLAEELGERHGFRVDFRDDGKRKPLNEETRVALYQMVRELLINVVKHADAKRVEVSIERFSEKIRVIVADNGSGIDSGTIQRQLAFSRSFGLFNVRHRTEYLGGKFSIESEIGCGTRISITLPLRQNETQFDS